MRPRAALTVPLLALVVLLGAVGVLWAYDETLTRHEDVEPGSSTEVVVVAEVRRGAEHELPEMVQGLALTCHLEVRSSLDPSGVRPAGPDRFAFTLRPALDDSDRRQLRGCLEDLRVDHVLVTVESMETRAA